MEEPAENKNMRGNDNNNSNDKNNENNNKDENENNKDDGMILCEAICICGFPMSKMKAKECYEGSGLNCDGCAKSVKLEEMAYHCKKQKTEEHSHGYDLCEDCAVRVVICHNYYFFFCSFCTFLCVFFLVVCRRRKTKTKTKSKSELFLFLFLVFGFAFVFERR